MNLKEINLISSVMNKKLESEVGNYSLGHYVRQLTKFNRIFLISMNENYKNEHYIKEIRNILIKTEIFKKRRQD